jgi:iron-sulfur cluster repair protein YtfE (RIC family)
VTAPGGRIQTLEPLPARLLATPLDFILADHHRHRVLCYLCEKLADAGELDTVLAALVADHIETELMDHIFDEEKDLFPLLRRRAKPEDDIEPVLAHLAGEHAGDEKCAAKIVNGLRRIIANPDKPMSTALQRTLRKFAASERRHLALENAIVIPLAKVRLTAKDQVDLSERMAARRRARLAGTAGSEDDAD